MAAIDKYYTRSNDEAKRLLEFCKGAGEATVGTFLGKEYTFNPYMHCYKDAADGWEDGTERPVWNSPHHMDYWLFKNCVEQGPLEDLRRKYGLVGFTKDSPDSDLLEEFCIAQDSKFEFSTKFKVISPVHNWFFRPSLNGYGKNWTIEVLDTVKDKDGGNHYFCWNEANGSFVPWGWPWDSFSTGCVFRLCDKGKWKKKFSKWIESHPMPKGAVLSLSGMYLGQEIKIEVV